MLDVLHMSRRIWLSMYAELLLLIDLVGNGGYPVIFEPSIRRSRASVCGQRFNAYPAFPHQDRRSRTCAMGVFVLLYRLIMAIIRVRPCEKKYTPSGTV